MGTKALSLVFAGGLVLGLAAADARAGKLGIIGDSISAAMDADDDCDTLFECAGNLGEDRGYSWSGGYATGMNGISFRKKLGSSSTADYSKNGSRWQDALGQATNVVNAGGVTHVTIELGGNDVCRKLNDTLPTKAQISSHIDATFSKLTQLPAGSKVVVGEAPNVVHLRNTMRNADNFAFETCQDLWDLNTSRLEVNTCDWGFFDFLCDIADFIIEVVADFVSPLTDAMLAAFNVNFPCGYVLSSSSNSTKRSLAQALNNDINAAIASKVAQYNGQGGVTFLLADDVYEYQFSSGEVSQLDCFHPNRRGQKNLAKLVWNSSDIGANGTAPSTDNGAPSVSTSFDASYWWYMGGGWYGMNTAFSTNENTRMDVWIDNCSTGYVEYLGDIRATPTDHDFDIIPFSSYEAANYWWGPTVRLSDTAGNQRWAYLNCI